MTPITLESRRQPPIYPLIAVPAKFDSTAEMKRTILVELESHGITCDAILDIMDDVKADPVRLRHWVTLVEE